MPCAADAFENRSFERVNPPVETMGAAFARVAMFRALVRR